MRKREEKITIREYDHIQELDESARELLLAARGIVNQAYAPYSNFKVGAAIRLDDGTIVKGNNQENAASPTGTCAERSALFWANANFPDRRVMAIAITAIDQDDKRAVNLSPCGTCRQALMEAQFRFKQRIEIILDSRSKIEVLDGIDQLLPLSFSADSLQSE